MIIFWKVSLDFIPLCVDIISPEDLGAVIPIRLRDPRKMVDISDIDHDTVETLSLQCLMEMPQSSGDEL